MWKNWHSSWLRGESSHQGRGMHSIREWIHKAISRLAPFIDNATCKCRKLESWLPLKWRKKEVKRKKLSSTQKLTASIHTFPHAISLSLSRIHFSICQLTEFFCRLTPCAVRMKIIVTFSYFTANDWIFENFHLWKCITVENATILIVQ